MGLGIGSVALGLRLRGFASLGQAWLGLVWLWLELWQVLSPAFNQPPLPLPKTELPLYRLAKDQAEVKNRQDTLAGEAASLAALEVRRPRGRRAPAGLRPATSLFAGGTACWRVVHGSAAQGPPHPRASSGPARHAPPLKAAKAALYPSRPQAQLVELGEAGLAARLEAARAARDEAAASLSAAERAVEAATRELAGAEAGDGRDESNRSAQERLADAANAQTAAEAEIKAGAFWGRGFGARVPC
jgi:hypothetical protein